jgi:hypothetical protein
MAIGAAMEELGAARTDAIRANIDSKAASDNLQIATVK